MLLVLVGHLLACIGVLYLMPGGWPWSSMLIWSYRIIPVLIAMAAVLAIASWPRRLGVDGLLLSILSGAWIGLMLGAPLQFAASWGRLASVCALGSLPTVLAFANRFATLSKREKLTSLASGFIGLMIACVVLATLRAPSPSAHPMKSAPAPPDVASANAERRNLRIDSHVSFDTTGATITVASGRHVMYVEPLLTFDQRSPDGCWTIFASRRDRVLPLRNLLSTTRLRDGAGAYYADRDELKLIASHYLSVRHELDRYDIDAASILPRGVWSHLNHITQLTVGGQRELRVRFSPVPQTAIDVLFADYPFGAPARFAYVDSAGTFKVVQASSAEKGPFTTLAEGPLGVGPLTMTLMDGDEPLFEVRLEDWAAQCSREVSPAAGWGVPQNAIEFSLDSNSPNSAATFFISLAATSVGRGWASVGHSAGTYRNRISLKLLASDSAAR